MTNVVRVSESGLTVEELAAVRSAIEDGQLIAFPTETVYGLGAAPGNEDAARRLNALKGRSPDHPLTLHLAATVDPETRAGELSPLARRLAARFWPGPLTQILPGARGGLVGLRYPRQTVLETVLEAVGGELLGTSANLSGQAPATTADAIPNELIQAVAVVIDDGPCRHAAASTVVKPEADTPVVVREGAIATPLILDECGPTTLIVCSGNTCRSPMAQVLLETMIRSRFQESRRVRGLPLPAVGSAGVAAMDGLPASHHAVQAVAGCGKSLVDHTSRRATRDLLQQADFILAVTDSARYSLEQLSPEAHDRITVLNAAHGGIPDPFGGTLRDYQQCADRLKNALETFLDRTRSRFLGEP